MIYETKTRCRSVLSKSGGSVRDISKTEFSEPHWRYEAHQTEYKNRKYDDDQPGTLGELPTANISITVVEETAADRLITSSRRQPGIDGSDDVWSCRSRRSRTQ